jgi:dUTP pyrophosphatase
MCCNKTSTSSSCKEVMTMSNIGDVVKCNCSAISTVIPIKFAKVRDVKTPSIAYDGGTAGIDFFVPNVIDYETLVAKNPELVNAGLYYSQPFFISQTGTIHLQPAQRILIPSGIHTKFPKGYALIAFEKSGVSTKKGLTVGAKVVDSNYCGEIHLSLINTSNKAVNIEFGEKIVQFIFIPVPQTNLIEVTSLEELYSNSVTSRGTGGFGSSGNK